MSWSSSALPALVTRPSAWLDRRWPQAIQWNLRPARRIRNLLSSAARASPWRIVATHHPSYGVGTCIGFVVTLPTCSSTVELQRGTVRPSLRQLKVAVATTTRLRRRCAGSAWPAGPLHIVARPIPRTSPRSADLCPMNVEFRLEARTGGTILAGAVASWRFWECAGSRSRMTAVRSVGHRVDFSRDVIAPRFLFVLERDDEN